MGFSSFEEGIADDAEGRGTGEHLSWRKNMNGKGSIHVERAAVRKAES